MMACDDWKDDPEYIERQVQFERRIAEQERLRIIVMEKYPEVYDWLRIVYQSEGNSLHWLPERVKSPTNQ
jgi:hypothetical protein